MHLQTWGLIIILPCSCLCSKIFMQQQNGKWVLFIILLDKSGILILWTCLIVYLNLFDGMHLNNEQLIKITKLSQLKHLKQGLTRRHVSVYPIFLKIFFILFILRFTIIKLSELRYLRLRRCHISIYHIYIYHYYFLIQYHKVLTTHVFQTLND